MLQMTELNGFLFKGFIETKINVPQNKSKGRWGTLASREKIDKIMEHNLCLQLA